MRHFCPRAGALAALLISVTAYAQGLKPAPAPDNPACLAAMQVIGHNGEAVITGWAPGGDLETDLNLASIADNLVRSAQRVITNDAAYCQKVVKTIPRIYPAYLDKSDHMSTGRIISDMTQLRIVAAAKPQLEAEANRDISH